MQRFRKILAFGDSLTDNGNLYRAIGGASGSERFSNGPVAVEYLATILRAELDDRAWGGATTGLGNRRDGGTPHVRAQLPGMKAAFSQLSRSSIGQETLLFIWGGINDFLPPLSSTALTSGSPCVDAVDNIIYMVEQGYDLGVRRVLVPNLPMFSTAPALRILAPDDAKSLIALSNRFNLELGKRIARVRATVTYFDAAQLSRQVVADPHSYGFHDVTNSLNVSQQAPATSREYLFYDHIHPSTAAHMLLAKAFAKSLEES